ncbi:hypothetical protein PVA38_11545 [Streptococcus pneumoniae D39]|nr:hypothetical protein PVA38_11545 [Streptococcus pneumoniae D39]
MCAYSSLCLLYTSDAADEARSVDLGGRRIIKKKIYTPSPMYISLSTSDFSVHLLMLCTLPSL